eukprot:7378216-Prymnesium_polylepis.1
MRIHSGGLASASSQSRSAAALRTMGSFASVSRARDPHARRAYPEAGCEPIHLHLCDGEDGVQPGQIVDVVKPEQLAVLEVDGAQGVPQPR